jgi:16S rRNA (cytosine967-C5)-methyltransferase
MSKDLTENLIGKADKVLVDAPCSGLGVLSKKPDIKWKRELKDINNLQSLQLEILESSLKYLKPNGVLVYSTCTTEAEENFDVIKIFLESHPEFSIDDAKEYVSEKAVNKDGCIELFPYIHNTDGAFSARLKKNN